MITRLDCAGRILDLSEPRIMGVLNVTPDSFSDGGRFLELKAALQQAESMLESGASIIDIGGESTRPGAAAVEVGEEIKRVIPVIEAIKNADLPVVISVDTSKPELMRYAVEAGAGMINDVRALREKGAVPMAASLEVPVCLMHMQGEPRTMQHNPQYENIITDVYRFLEERIQDCRKGGIPRERLLVDPGFGFGKTVAQNLTMLKHLRSFSDLEVPLLVGLSRKSMFGALLDKPVDQRVVGSITAAVIAIMNGAHIIRVHDVAETMQAIKVLNAVSDAQ